MKLFEITTDRCFYIITIFGIKISIKSKKLLEEKLNEKESKLYEKELKLHEIQNNAISNIKESISELQKENMLKKYDICFLQLVHNSDMDNLYKYFHGYNYKIIRFKKIPELFSDLGLKNFIAILSSKIVVINIDTYITNDHLFEDQILINLWHACGVFKKIGPGRNDSADFYYKFDYFITSGNICNKIYSDNFLTDINKFISLGVSRTDNLFDENYINNVKTEFYNKNPDLKNKKIYFYCPTFREEIINEFIFKSNLDLTKLSELLYDNEVFIFKLHPFLISRINNNQSKDNIINMQNINNNNILDFSEYNILDLLIISDVIMTDYSSAFMEGLLLNKPVVFAADDIDKYERGFFIDYRKDLPGEIVESGKAEDILKALRDASIDHPNYKVFKENHLGACDGKSSERIADFIKNIIKDQTRPDQTRPDQTRPNMHRLHIS